VTLLASYHNRLFSEPPTFGGKQYTFNKMNKFCISQGSAVTFFRCGEHIRSHGYSLFYSEMIEIIRTEVRISKMFLGFSKVKWR